MSELLTTAALVSEMPLESAAPAVDLATISQQLETMTALQMAQASNQWALMGLILGVVVALVIGRLWR